METLKNLKSTFKPKVGPKEIKIKGKMKNWKFSLLLVFFTSITFVQNSFGQAFNASVFPQGQCTNPLNIYTISAIVSATSAGATSYSWQIQGPTGPCPILTISAAPNTGTALNATVSCCGVYTAFCTAWNNGNFIQSVQANFTVFCATSASVSVAGTSTSNAICQGSSATLTAIGATSAVWVAQNCFGTNTLATGPATIVHSPQCNTTYTMIGTNSSGCPVNATTQINVQSATVTASPATASLCPGAPFNVTSTTTIGNNTLNYSPGTVSTTVQWKNPNGTTIGAAANINNVAAIAGPYSVIVTYTGAAGTCTTLSTINVSTISTINVSIITTPTSGTICAGQSATLTANSIQTAAASYSWQNSFFPFTNNGVKSIVKTPPASPPTSTVRL